MVRGQSHYYVRALMAGNKTMTGMVPALSKVHALDKFRTAHMMQGRALIRVEYCQLLERFDDV